METSISGLHLENQKLRVQVARLKARCKSCRTMAHIEVEKGHRERGHKRRRLALMARLSQQYGEHPLDKQACGRALVDCHLLWIKELIK